MWLIPLLFGLLVRLIAGGYLGFWFLYASGAVRFYRWFGWIVGRFDKAVVIEKRAIGDAAVRSIAQGIMSNTRCKRLVLNEVGMTERSIDMLVTMVQTNSSLTELDISTNGELGPSVDRVAQAVMQKGNFSLLDLSNTGVLPRSVFASLLQHKQLRCLKLWGTRFEDEDFEMMARALQEPQVALEELDLTWCPMSAQGIKMLAEGLSSNRRIKSLILARTSLDPSCGAPLGAMLRTNSVLQTLDLSYNFQFDEGYLQVFYALAEENKSLTKLSMTGMSVGYVGLVHLLRNNSTLRVLDVQMFEAFADVSLLQIARALVGHKSLERFDFFVVGDLAKLGDKTNAQIMSLLRQNGSLIESGFLQHQALCARNRRLHQAAKDAAMALLMIRARKNERCVLHAMPKEIVALIAKDVWASKTQVGVWEKKVKK